MCFLLFMISNLYFGQGFGPVWTSEDLSSVSFVRLLHFYSNFRFPLKLSYVELLKLPIQCHQCLNIVEGGAGGMVDHLYQVHETTAYYENTW